MTSRFKCQQIIDDIRRLKTAHPSTLRKGELHDLEGIMQKEYEWENRRSKYITKDIPKTYKTGYFDTVGNEITMIEWSLAQNEDNTIYADIINGFLVSTVWLGLSHGFREGRILIFETMIFSEEDGGCAFDGYQRRYETLEEALSGHKEACELVRNYIPGRPS